MKDRGKQDEYRAYAIPREKRQESIEKVTWAIQTLQDLEGEDAIIRSEKIIEMTGLSKTAIYKPHLRTLWDQQWIGTNIDLDNMISKMQHNRKVVELEKRWNVSINS